MAAIFATLVVAVTGAASQRGHVELHSAVHPVPEGAARPLPGKPVPRTPEEAWRADHAPDAYAPNTPDPLKPHLYEMDGTPIYAFNDRDYPDQDFIDPLAGRFKAKVLHFGNRQIIIQTGADEPSLRDTLRFLGQKIASPISVIAMLDPVIDAAIIGRAREAWNDDSGFTRGLVDEEKLQVLFAARRHERVIMFGHIEQRGQGRGEGSFVAYARDGSSMVVPISLILEISRAHDVEAIIVGCNSFAAGAPAGVLRPIDGAEIPVILGAMRRATFRAELIAAVATPDRPVFIDPVAFSQALAGGLVAVARFADPEPSLVFQPGATATAANLSAESGLWGGVWTGAKQLFWAFCIVVAAIHVVRAFVLQQLARIFTYVAVRTGRCVKAVRVLNWILALPIDLFDRDDEMGGLVTLGLIGGLAFGCWQVAIGNRSIISVALIAGPVTAFALLAAGRLAEHKVETRNR